MRTKSSRYSSRRLPEALHASRGGPRWPEGSSPQSPPSCKIVERGGRRGGGKRYWCLRHRADATAKFGVAAPGCRRAEELPLPPPFEINLDEYSGGVGLWGAVPAVYDTTRQPLDRGVHIHARSTLGPKKNIDKTYRSVRVRGARLPADGALVSELDAIYFMVSSVFGFETQQLLCHHCGTPHLDRDWFSVHPHRRHLCAACGRYFVGTAPAIANPIIGVRGECRVEVRKPTPSSKSLTLDQAEYEGGLQIWGSNPALIWTSDVAEEEGIHVHAFRTLNDEPEIDDTVAQVTIDGITLDAVMVRTLMAQSVLPHVSGRLRSIDCPRCGDTQFDVGELAFTPRGDHTCQSCGHQIVVRGRVRKVVANPLPKTLETLAAHAPRRPQPYGIDLQPEAPRSSRASHSQ